MYIINIHALNNMAPKCMKQKLRNEEGNGQFNNNTWRLQYLTFNYEHIDRRLQGNRRFEQNYKTT